MKILKTLIHPLTPAQQDELAGNEIFELKVLSPELGQFLANTPDNDQALKENAQKLIEICKKFDAILLPCGSPKFAFIFAQLWAAQGIVAQPLFAHSERVSVEKEVAEYIEKPDAPGTFMKVPVIQKQSVFNHIRFF